MTQILSIMAACALCGCGTNPRISSEDYHGTNCEWVMDAPPGATNFTATITVVTNCYDLTDRRAYRIMTDGERFQVEQNSEYWGWMGIGARETIEQARADIDWRINYFKREQAAKWVKVE